MTKWLTVNDAAAHASVSTALVYRAAQDGHLSGVKLNPDNLKSPWRFTVADVDAWLERGRIKASA